MNRYEQGDPDDIFEPGSDGRVLRNRLGLTDVREVGLTEAALLSVAQARSLSRIETDTLFTVDLICGLHRTWLESLYEFAGKIRTVDLSKGGIRFAPVAYLQESLDNLDRILAEHTPCERMDDDQVVQAIALVHVEFILVHPFREGNGRMARWIADLMALQAGLPPLEWGFDWNPHSRRERYFAAIRRGFLMDFKALQALVKEAIDSAIHLEADRGGEP